MILTFLLWVWHGDVAHPRFHVWRGAARGHRAARAELAAADPAIRYSFSNQFELPVLFYVLTILAYITHHAGLIFVILAWIFVIFRLLHAYVHVTSNIVRCAGTLYGIAVVALAINWVIYIFEVLTLPRPL